MFFKAERYYISTRTYKLQVTRTFKLLEGYISGGNTDMSEKQIQDKQSAILFIESIAVVAILSILMAVTIPHIGQMIYQSKAEARNAELLDIQSAVTEMLYDSTSGVLEPVGPVDDLKQVKTRDAQPLVLSDYLLDGDDCIKSGCSYLFTADGTVVQMMP